MMNPDEKEFSREMLLVQSYADGEPLSPEEVQLVEETLLKMPEYKNFFDEIKVLDSKLREIDGVKPSENLVRNVQEILVTEKIPQKKKSGKISYYKYVAAAALVLLLLNYNSLHQVLFDLHGASSLDRIYIKKHLATTTQSVASAASLKIGETKDWFVERLSFVPNIPDWELFEIKGRDVMKINEQETACIIFSHNSKLATLFILNAKENAPYTSAFQNEKYKYISTTNYQIRVWNENDQEYILVANYDMGNLEYLLGFYNQ